MAGNSQAVLDNRRVEHLLTLQSAAQRQAGEIPNLLSKGENREVEATKGFDDPGEAVEGGSDVTLVNRVCCVCFQSNALWLSCLVMING